MAEKREEEKLREREGGKKEVRIKNSKDQGQIKNTKRSSFTDTLRERIDVVARFSSNIRVLCTTYKEWTWGELGQNGG